MQDRRNKLLNQTRGVVTEGTHGSNKISNILMIGVCSFRNMEKELTFKGTRL